MKEICVVAVARKHSQFAREVYQADREAMPVGKTDFGWSLDVESARKRRKQSERGVVIFKV